jgi:hypothetical protein
LLKAVKRLDALVEQAPLLLALLAVATVAMRGQVFTAAAAGLAATLVMVVMVATKALQPVVQTDLLELVAVGVVVLEAEIVLVSHSI